MPKSNDFPRIMAAIMHGQWMILPDSLNQILAIVERTNDAPEMVAAKLGRPLENTRTVENRNGVAVIPVTGPIFRYASLFTRVSGASAVEDMAVDFNEALANPSVKSIVLEIDSPGGEASGINEFADMIYNARGQKPITAYVSSYGCSAAYWIASAADEIVMNDTAAVGSIGVVTTVRKNPDENTMEIVSTQSPYKRPDMSTDEGKAKMQGYVDDLASVFISRVARNRGVTNEKVLSDYGQGDILVGQKAVNAGLADRLGSLESVIAESQEKAGQQPQFTQKANVKTETEGVSTAMDLETLRKEHPELVQSLQAEAAEAERNRIKAVESSAMPGHEELISSLKFDGKTTGDQAASQVLAAEKASNASILGKLHAEAPAAVPQPNLPSADKPSVSKEDLATMDETQIAEHCKAQWNSNVQLRDDFLSVDDYVAFTKADTKGLIKILKK
jgi:signal peptide peptidase SppA